ncbi:hypothetical protein L6452_04298 [Arctium lappa]|uniref:Uncharacterized protein n=1 Tax=Arctium lappa TaxID=4217 RepID=A0ACB9FP92_ARCLA|nr:hypothetical protein L6452_04298 [Arctium lappa]
MLAPRSKSDGCLKAKILRFKLLLNVDVPLNSHKFSQYLSYELVNPMAKDRSIKPRAMSYYFEKIFRAAFGRSRRLPKKNDVPNPSLSTFDYPTPQTRVSSSPLRSATLDVKPFKHFNDRDVGQKTFSEEKYNSYIDGMKMKMRCPSDVGVETTVSRCDSFNDTVSSFISRSKLKLVNPEP